MARNRVTCIRKTNRYDPHDRIEGIGGYGWYTPQEEAIRRIEQWLDSYYVLAGGIEVDVIVAERFGRKYLKTRNDGEQPNNLLSLPECVR